MKNLFLTKTRWLVTIILLTALGIGNAWGETVTYKQTSTSAASVNSGTAPAGSSVSFNNTYTTKEQLTAGNQMELTLTSLGGISISNITLSMKSNKSSGAGKLSYSTDGGKTWTYLVGSSSQGTVFSNAAWNSHYSTSYVNVSKDVSLSNVTQLKIRIEATVKSLYCQSFTITYTAASCTTSPTVAAASNSSVTATTATVSCSGGITRLGNGCSISSYGFVIGTSADPEIGGSGVTQHEVGTTYTSTGVSFSKDLTGLTAETTYYVRPYATNGNGTAYGTQTSFTTSALPKYTVTLEDDGDTRTQASAGASVTLPVRAGCAGYTFAGWTKTWGTDQTEWTTTAPTIIPAGNYTPTANENLYPVYTKEEGGGEPVETITQTFQYDTWTNGGSSTDKSSYRLFHNGGYVESALDVDFSKLSKVIVYGGTFGGTSYNKISIRKADDTVWKNATVSGSKETGTNTITGGASLTGSAKLRVYSTCGSSSSGSGVRISKVEVYTKEGGTTTSYISVPNCSAPTNFPNNKTIFIQAHSTSAWTGGGCVKAWFHSYGGSETAQPTYWLFDAGSPDEGKKLFAAIVPTTGDLPYLDIQRFAANCSDWWNKNGGCSYSDAAGSNTIRSEGYGNDQVYWNASGVTLSLYGDPNSWASSLGTFADQGAGVWTATYNNYAPANAAGETQNFKISTNYNGWIGNTGSNNNATLDGMHVGSTYNITATLDVKDHSLTMSKTFVKGTVHFNLQGHGTAISDLTNVAAGSKISAPSPAPIVTGWDFGGWYKEPACTNEWNFASDVVNETMTLYAVWTKTPVEELLLNYSELNKYVGDPAVTLEVTGVTPEGADASVTWSSSNSSVASVVAATGVVTFGTVGTATITATSTVTGTTTAYCHVTVRNKPTATFVDLIHDGNGTDLSTYNMQNVAGTAIVFPTLDDYATPGDDCDTKHYVFVGWTTSDNNDDPQDHLVASGELEDGQDKVFYAVWADGVEGVSYTKLTTNSFKTSPTKYVIGAEYNGDTYYFYNCAATDANNGNGSCTTSPATNAPIQFTLSGTADALVATSTEAPARYLTPLTGNNFQMSATTKTIALSENGDILNASTTTWALRFNTSNKYLRWYNTAPGSAAYFYEVTAGAAVSYRTSCCTNNVPAPTVIATNTAYTVTLTWAAVDGATGYEVSWNGGAFEAATSPCVKSGLTASTDYIYKVRATYDPLVKCGALVASGNVTTDDVYSVTYSGGTGTGSCSPSGSVAPVSYEAGATVTLAPTNSFSLTSNRFAAWVVKDAENNDVAVSNNQFTMPASNVTVTATWTAVQDKYYDRMHQSTDASHGGIADGNGKYYIVREGCNYTVPSPADDSTGDTDCHTTHFKLLGWIAQSHLKSDGSIKDGAESHLFQGGTIKSATGATYYAIYAIMTE